MASSLPAGRSEVECSVLSIKIEFRPRRSTDSPRPSCSSPQDAKRQDRDPPDPKSTSVVSEVYPLQTRMRPNLVDPFGLADSASAWQVGWEWLSGTDSRRHDFTDGDPFTELLRHHQHIQDLINDVCNGTLPQQ